MFQVRKNERRPIRLKMIYDDGDSWVSAFVDDASESGLMIEGPEPIEVGREVRLEPDNPAEDAFFELRGKVVRCYEVDPTDGIDRWGAALYAIAVELKDVPTERRQAIREMLAR